MDVAVIGMHCRVPGANNVSEFWSLIEQNELRFSSLKNRPFSKSLIEECNRLQLDVDHVMTAGLIDDPYSFDESFFGMSGKEAEAYDPQGRILLECTNQLLENSYLNRSELAGSNTGVFVGISGFDYLQDILLNLNPAESLDIYHATGNSGSSIVGRLAYFFDWKGPAVAIDTACSSSLVSVAQACQALKSGEVDLAVAGGVSLLLNHISCITFSQANMTSPSGQCRPFDKAANGYVRGEGCSLVLLKKLDDAIRDQDVIHAVIKSCKTNQDGRSNGITAPNPRAQEDLITSCWSDCDVREEGIAYIEAHGTGTRLGDPIEIKALSAAIKAYGLDNVPVGSVKGNIGHLEAAAGTTGLIKAILVGQHRHIPAQANLEEINPLLSRYKKYVNICQEPMEIQTAKSLVCVSSFGFSGTNAHALIEVSPPDIEATEDTISTPAVVGVSAKTKARLIQNLKHVYEKVDRSPGINSISQIVSEFQNCEQFDARTAFVATSKAEFLAGVSQSIESVASSSDEVYNALGRKKLRLLLQDAAPKEERYSGYEAFQQYSRFYRLITECADESLACLLHSASAYSLAHLLLNVCSDASLSVPDINQLSGVDRKEQMLARVVRINALAAESTIETSAEDLTICVGNDLRILDRRFASAYGQNAVKNTAITLGVLYCCKQISRVPYYFVPKRRVKYLDACVFDRKHFYHAFYRKRQDHISPHGSEGDDFTVKRYVEEWMELKDYREAAKGSYDRRLLLIGESDGEESLPAGFQYTFVDCDVEQCDISLEDHDAVIIYLKAPELPGVVDAVNRAAKIYKEIRARNRDRAFKLNYLVDVSTPIGKVLYESVSGLFATLALEDPSCCGLVIASDDLGNASTWNRICSLIRSPVVETEVYVKMTSDNLYVKRLVRSEERPVGAASAGENAWKGGCVVVTGGSSGVGFSLVEHAIDHAGVAKVVILGRRAITEPLKALIDKARGLDVECSYIQCDIADMSTYRDALLASVEDQLKVHVVHAANDDGQSVLLQDMPADELAKVWGPKVKGLLNLTSALRGRLSSLYLFSSISALWGMSGKGAYSAANGFLKGVADSKILAESCLSESTACHLWGVWENSGMFDRADASARLASIGLGTHSNEFGFQVIMSAVENAESPSIVAALSEDHLPNNLTKAKSLFSGLKTSSSNSADQQSRKPLKGTQEMMEFIERYLINEEKLSLSIPDDRTRGLFDLGLNSLVIADLCYRIKKEYGVEVSVTEIFNAPTIEKLSEFIFTQYNEK